MEKKFNKGKLTNKSVPIKSPEEQELIRLRKELADIKLERDILKKAVGIFSKSDK
jgi:transposase